MALTDSPDSNASDYIDEDDVLAVVVPNEMAGERLDKVLAQLVPQYSRNRLQKWIEAGLVTLGGQPVKIRQEVRAGDSLVVFPQPSAEDLAFSPEDIPLDVVHEDSQLLVLHKPPSLVVHPAAGHWTGTLLNGLLYRYPELAGVPRAGIVHRLDKETSGLLMVARTLEAQTALVRLLQERSVTRRYVCFVWGAPPNQVVRKAIGRDPRDRLKMAVVSEALGKPAITHVTALKTKDYQGQKVSMVMCQLETGRTHQIRVHMESLGHPLLGDTVYRKKAPQIAQTVAFNREGQALHAFVLGLVHPQTHESLLWKAPLPYDMMQLGIHLGFTADELNSVENMEFDHELD